ncbi:MAG TPA: DUF4331 family protein [Kofleriaceae bacterium]
MADINDVYTWMTTDTSKINLAMTVSPGDDGMHEFGAAVQYVFHLTRYVKIPLPKVEEIGPGQESKIVCTFASATSGQCWVVDPAGKVVEYVKGDFSSAAGATSMDGKLKVFAGRRSDPFFFNLGGFARAVGAAITACGGSCPGGTVVPDAGGCPQLPPTTVKGVLSVHLSEKQTTSVAGCPANEFDCFINANVMALVVQVDTTLIATDTQKTLGVWGSTHAAP